MRLYRFKVIFTLEGNGYDGKDYENEIVFASSNESARGTIINRYKNIAHINILDVRRIGQ